MQHIRRQRAAGSAHLRGDTIKVLFITQLCPYPPSSGGAIKTYNILKYLGSRHEVSLLTFIRRESETLLLSNLSEYCRRIDFCMIHRSEWLNVLHAARSLLTNRSFVIARDWHPGMWAKVSAFLEDSPDVIYVDHLQMAQYVPHPAPCPVLLDDHNVEWRIIERFASAGTPLLQRLFASLEWRRLRSYELDACSKADRVLTVTPQDRDVLASNGVPVGKVFPLPVGVDTDQLKPIALSAKTSKVLTFGTMSWPPNVDAVSYFGESIYPLVRREVPDAEFDVVGANPPPKIASLSRRDPSIKVTGYVEDIRAAAEGAAVFVVPLRIGSGMRVKILDAMALGLPIVTTSIGCEGISLVPGEHALVADTPREFAGAVVRLLRDYRERIRLGRAGRALAENVYAWPHVLRHFDTVLLGITSPLRRRTAGCQWSV